MWLRGVSVWVTHVVLYKTDDVLEISVVHGLRCVGGVCEMGMARCWCENIVFGLYQSCRNRGSVGYVSVVWWCWADILGGWGVVLSVCVVILKSVCRWKVQVSI